MSAVEYVTVVNVTSSTLFVEGASSALAMWLVAELDGGRFFALSRAGDAVEAPPGICFARASVALPQLKRTSVCGVCAGPVRPTVPMMDTTSTLPTFFLVFAACGSAEGTADFITGDVVVGSTAMVIMNFSLPVSAASAEMFGRSAIVKKLSPSTVLISVSALASDLHASVATNVSLVSINGDALVLQSVHAPSDSCIVGADVRANQCAAGCNVGCAVGPITRAYATADRPAYFAGDNLTIVATCVCAIGYSRSLRCSWYCCGQVFVATAVCYSRHCDGNQYDPRFR